MCYSGFQCLFSHEIEFESSIHTTLEPFEKLVYLNTDVKIVTAELRM